MLRLVSDTAHLTDCHPANSQSGHGVPHFIEHEGPDHRLDLFHENEIALAKGLASRDVADDVWTIRCSSISGRSLRPGLAEAEPAHAPRIAPWQANLSLLPLKALA